MYGCRRTAVDVRQLGGGGREVLPSAVIPCSQKAPLESVARAGAASVRGWSRGVKRLGDGAQWCGGAAGGQRGVSREARAATQALLNTRLHRYPRSRPLDKGARKK
jgi:hypothetical protein